MKTHAHYYGTTLGEIQAATQHLDRAKIVPLQLVDNGQAREIKRHVGVYNSTRSRFCAAVRTNYNLVQHQEYFDAFAESLNRLGIKYSMEISQTGNQAFADIKFEGRNIKFQKLNEEFTTGFRVTNSYDRTRGLSIAPLFTRLACTNGMVITRSERMFSIRHNSNLVKEIERLIEVKIGELISKHKDLELWVSQSMTDSVEWATACKLLEKLVTFKKHREEILKRLDIALIEIKDKKTKKKTYRYIPNKDEDANKRFTRWEVYNCITDYISHGEQITPLINSFYQRKAEMLLVTPFAEIIK